jgi:uncharacterized damage-inducible protein DinB
MLTELENYLLRQENLRGQVIDLIRDLPAEALNWQPTPQVDDHATNPIAALAAHIAGAEQHWVAEVIGGEPRQRERPREFETQVEDACELVARLEAMGQKTRAILSALPASILDETREFQDRTLVVRWIILHLIDHTALHLGHMQITYQIWNQGRGVHAPRWYQRLPE